jgi:putative tricarboxylic transport membrane protein
VSKRVELAVAIALTAFGVFYLDLASHITRSVKNDPIGERGVPYALGTFFVIGGVVLIIRALLSARRDGWVRPGANEPGDEPEYPSSSVRPLVMWAVFAAWAFFVADVGFLILTPFAIAIELWLLWFRRPIRLAALSIFGTAFIWVVFDYLLQINLPAGLLESVTEGWQL